MLALLPTHSKLCGKQDHALHLPNLIGQACMLFQIMAEHLQLRPDLLPGLLNTLFEVVLFEECSNQWSMSRPMLSLILINEQIYPQLKARLVASQPLSRCADCIIDIIFTDSCPL